MNILYNGDCFNILEKIENNSVDLIFFDPPFNVGVNYGENINDNIDNYLQWQYSILDKSIDKLKNNGFIVYYNISKWIYKIANYLDEKGLYFNNSISWVANGATPLKNNLVLKNNQIIVFSKSEKAIVNKQYINIKRCRHCKNPVKDYGGYYKKLKENLGEKIIVLSDVWDDIHRITHKKYKHRAANQLPEKLLKRIILLWSQENSLILDPFMGTGTTCYMAKKLNRNYIGIEKNIESFLIAKDRIDNSKIQVSLI